MLGCASNDRCMPCKICMLLSSTLFPCSYVVQLLLPVCVKIYILWDSFWMKYLHYIFVAEHLIQTTYLYDLIFKIFEKIALIWIKSSVLFLKSFFFINQFKSWRSYSNFIKNSLSLKLLIYLNFYDFYA